VRKILIELQPIRADTGILEELRHQYDWNFSYLVPFRGWEKARDKKRSFPCQGLSLYLFIALLSTLKGKGSKHHALYNLKCITNCHILSANLVNIV